MSYADACLRFPSPAQHSTAQPSLAPRVLEFDSDADIDIDIDIDIDTVVPPHHAVPCRDNRPS
jgi:hypothetical protein